MKTKLWHIGLASAILGGAGLAHAQSAPPAGFSNDLESIESPSVTAPGTASSTSGTYDSSSGMNNSPNWNNSQDLNQAPAEATEVPPADSLAELDARGEQGVQSSDGMNIPPAFSGTGFPREK